MIRIFGHYVPGRTFALVAIEFAILLSAPYAGVALRWLDPAALQTVSSLDPLPPKALLFALGVIGCMTAFGLYQGEFREGTREIGVRVLMSFAVSIALLAVAFYLLPELYLGRGVVALAYAVAFLGITLTRLLFFRWTDLGIFRSRVLVLGTGTRAVNVDLVANSPESRRSMQVVGYMPIKTTQHFVEPSRILGEDSIMSVVRAHGIDEIVLAIRDRRGGGLPLQELLECKLAGVRITELSSFFERERGQLRLESLNASYMILGDGFRQGFMRESVKRPFDIIMSLAILLMSLPLTLITALLIAIEDGFPIFYRQERVGQGGRVFTIFKFRSMRTDAEKDGRPRWAQAGDDRTTRVGRIIRKLRIDEIPQIWNVLKGEMSFVGPRPERPFFVEQLAQQIPYYAARHSIKPGLTGWAQVRYQYGSTLDDAIEKLQYDLYYVKNHCLFLDIMILVDTVQVVLWGKGAR